MQKNYSEMTRDELRQVAKEMDIPGRGSMTKQQLCDAIVSAVYAARKEAKAEEKQEENKTAVSDVKLWYINNAKQGTIVAFKTNINGYERVKSAAVTNISRSRQLLKLTTKYGVEYIVRFCDVVWVKTGSRWPRAIYNLLKGINDGK